MSRRSRAIQALHEGEWRTRGGGYRTQRRDASLASNRNVTKRSADLNYVHTRKSPTRVIPSFSERVRFQISFSIKHAIMFTRAFIVKRDASKKKKKIYTEQSLLSAEK